MRAWIAPSLALFHLMVLASGIFSVSVGKVSALRASRDLYQTFTGAGGSWGFFSPDVGNQIMIDFEVNRGSLVRLHELVSPEVALRIGNMYRLFVQSYENENLKRSVAASLASQIFRRRADAHVVTMIASIYRFPSLQEYGQGLRPEKKEVYRITFTTKKGAKHAP
jgi:hypothetical protein